MKKRYVILFVVVISNISLITYYFYNRSLYYQEAHREIYPPSMGSISCDTLIKNYSALPEDLKEEVDIWINNNKEMVDHILTIPQLTTRSEWKKYNKKAQKLAHANLSNNNYIFDINSAKAPAVVKISGLNSRLLSIMSSLGYDPYKTDITDYWIGQATSMKIPTQQHISRAATQHLLKQINSSTIVPLETYLYQIPGKPNDCDDTNFIIVQRKLNNFSQFSQLPHNEKIEFLQNLDLRELYKALKYANLWDISETNLWVGNDNSIAYPDGEKPNNEGFGRKARWKVAVLGHDLEKAKFNIRNWKSGGHRAFEAILHSYAPERVQEWMAYYENDPELQNQP